MRQKRNKQRPSPVTHIAGPTAHVALVRHEQNRPKSVSVATSPGACFGWPHAAQVERDASGSPSPLERVWIHLIKESKKQATKAAV
jgi:hypothetical protein